MRAKKCENCVYYVVQVGELAHTARGVEPFGRCRRFPPMSCVEGSRYGFNAPPVGQSFWCGEYKENKKKLDKKTSEFENKTDEYALAE